MFIRPWICCIQAPRLALSLLKPRNFGTVFAPRTLLTLRPEKFASVNQELIDVSGLTSKKLRVDTVHPQWPNIADGRFVFVCPRPSGKVCTFPPNTRGFLYYRQGSTPIGGQLRFRLCASAQAFGQGEDLVTWQGVPWCVPFIDIVKCSIFKILLPLLLQDGLIDESLLADAIRINSTCDSHLYKMTDPFLIDLEHVYRRFALITRKSVNYASFTFMMQERRGGVELSPYKGRLWARFELSNFPEHAPFGPTLVLKFLEQMEPIQTLVPDYDGYIERPIPGNYLMRAGKLWHRRLKKRLGLFKDVLEASKVPANM